MAEAAHRAALSSAQFTRTTLIGVKNLFIVKETFWRVFLILSDFFSAARASLFALAAERTVHWSSVQ